MDKLSFPTVRKLWTITALAICASSLAGAPFKADKDTLLLSGFEKSL